ncbi:MAG TPA: ATP-binding protein, partial [Ktedonobacteraceae bacterium]|nr:ATP-binding protein [Ktedonobacteraceae bacterium]
MVRRLKTLVSATTLVADGDYQQRLRVGSRDELGQLEQQFNRMAEQLGARAAREKVLIEENARLAERSHISREPHDAISQDLISLSLSEALKELATAYSTHLGITVKTQLAPLHLEANLEHTLLRIAQEALSNAARHASASEITLTLALDRQTVTLALQDNGQGLQMDEENRRHGLGLIEERAQELHGTLDLSSTPGQGTTLEVHFPLL